MWARAALAVILFLSGTADVLAGRIVLTPNAKGDDNLVVVVLSNPITDPLQPITKGEEIAAGFFAGMAAAGAFIWWVTREGRNSDRRWLQLHGICENRGTMGRKRSRLPEGGITRLTGWGTENGRARHFRLQMPATTHTPQ